MPVAAAIDSSCHMRPETAALVILQTRDTEIQKLANELAEIPKEQARANDHLKSSLEELAKAKSAVMEHAVGIKKLELDIDTRKNTIARLNNQQFETRKNEEYTALGNEVVRYKKEVDTLETELLELMETADLLSQAQKKAENLLAEAQKVVDEKVSALAAKKANLETRLAESRAGREPLVAKVEESDLSMYTRLLKSKNGLALAEVSESGQCLGCHIKLIPATIVKLRGHKDLVLCENCSRILYEP